MTVYFNRALCLAIATAWCWHYAPGAAAQSLAITDVTLIDGTGRAPAAGMTVLTNDGRIQAIGPTRDVEIPDDARRVGADGLYLIPGLWDMHVHITFTTELALPAFVANGVTGVRDMGGDLEQLNALRDAIRRRDRIGPRIIRAGPTVDGYKGGLEHRWVVASSGDGRKAVIELSEKQVDFIKIHNAVPREAYFALAEAASRHGLRFSGHIPMTVSPQEAIDAGQNSIEHTETLVEGVLSSKQFGLALGWSRFRRRDAPQLFAQMAQRGIAYDPILIAYWEGARRRRVEQDPDPRAEYVALSLRESWPGSFRTRSATVEFLRRRVFRSFLALVGSMNDAGVLILAGTDAGGRNVYPGFSLHDELALLVDAGLTPMQALQAATLNPAKHLGLEESLGTVEAGKIADLVLLDANPLADIENTRRIHAVVARGRYLSRDDLGAMLRDVKERAPNY